MLGVSRSVLPNSFAGSGMMGARTYAVMIILCTFAVPFTAASKREPVRVSPHSRLSPDEAPSAEELLQTQAASHVSPTSLLLNNQTVDTAECQVPGTEFVATAMLVYGLADMKGIWQLVGEAITKHKLNKDATAKVVDETEHLFEKILGGSVDIAHLSQNSYLQLKNMGIWLHKVKKFCSYQTEKSTNALKLDKKDDKKWEEISSNISKIIEEINGKMNQVAQDVFCDRFGNITKERMIEAGLIIDNWQDKTGKTWTPAPFPQGSRYKNQVSYMSYIFGGRTDAWDPLLADTSFPRAQRIRFSRLIEKVRLVLTEMFELSNIVPDEFNDYFEVSEVSIMDRQPCMARAIDLDNFEQTMPDGHKFALCDRCPQCCARPIYEDPDPSEQGLLARIVRKTMHKKPCAKLREFSRKAFLKANNAMLKATADSVPVVGPLVYLAARAGGKLIDRIRKKEHKWHYCGDMLSFLQAKDENDLKHLGEKSRKVVAHFEKELKQEEKHHVCRHGFTCSQEDTILELKASPA